jgi:hypothetical protein
LQHSKGNPVGGRLSQAAQDFTTHVRVGLIYARATSQHPAGTAPAML